MILVLRSTELGDRRHEADNCKAFSHRCIAKWKGVDQPEVVPRDGHTIRWKMVVEGRGRGLGDVG
jgi:hypothetical protein